MTDTALGSGQTPTPKFFPIDLELRKTPSQFFHFSILIAVLHLLSEVVSMYLGLQTNSNVLLGQLRRWHELIAGDNLPRVTRQVMPTFPPAPILHILNYPVRDQPSIQGRSH